MERDTVITEFRVVDQFGNDVKLSKETTLDAIENGIVDAYFLYEEFIKFLKSAGFGEETIAQIQYIDNEE